MDKIPSSLISKFVEPVAFDTYDLAILNINWPCKLNSHTILQITFFDLERG